MNGSSTPQKRLDKKILYSHLLALFIDYRRMAILHVHGLSRPRTGLNIYIFGWPPLDHSIWSPIWSHLWAMRLKLQRIRVSKQWVLVIIQFFNHFHSSLFSHYHLSKSPTPCPFWRGTIAIPWQEILSWWLWDPCNIWQPDDCHQILWHDCCGKFSYSRAWVPHEERPNDQV